MSTTQSERLKLLRRKEGLSLRAVEDRVKTLGVDISYKSIGEYERKPVEIKMPVLRALAKVYKTTIEFIERGEMAPSRPGPHDTVSFVNIEDLEFIELPFIVPAAYGSFVNSCHEKNYGDFETVKIIKQPGTDYKGAVVVKIRGNSMAPRYPEGSCHVARSVSDGNWQHALGVHIISLRSEMFLIKRVVSNINGILKLRSDANGEEMEIQLGDINCMWKVGEATFMPAED